MWRYMIAFYDEQTQIKVVFFSDNHPAMTGSVQFVNKSFTQMDQHVCTCALLLLDLCFLHCGK